MSTSYYDYVSIRFKALLRPPSSTTYNFHIDSDDGTSVYIGSSYLLSQKATTCVWTYDFSTSLTGNTDYYFMVEWGDYNIGAYIKVYWSYGAQSQVIIPSNYFYYPEQVGSTPYQVRQFIYNKLM